MNGVLFYLDRDVPLVHGHAIYIDSEWALTSISQAQFWTGVDLERYGDGRVKGILSVDVSDWQTPGRRTGKVAARCTREEIRDEVWGQLADHLNDGPEPVLDERHVLRLVPGPGDRVPQPERRHQPRAAADQHGRLVGRPAGRRHADPEPAAGRRLRAHQHRPRDDGGRQRGRAARGQRDPRRDSGSPRPVREVFTLREPPCLGPARALDELRWRLVPPAGAAAARGRRRRRRGAAQPARARRCSPPGALRRRRG